ncbi:hypothetical protein F4820DRAFT_212382 [Hypoxylon rubiginosum]|uniref:Uncharacterized protein n=1 Tax=Hypoxylon rubiginosum TaxID=110542 RepID=A0ACB9YHR4_9PEZI|nr:hypothetical protein F4820DRAFT_212382 [Hypoxylon rubiginosum]
MVSSACQGALIAVAGFVGILLVMVLVARWLGVYLCCRLPRWRKKTPKANLPRSIQLALTRLESVTEKRPNRNPLTESEDAECPICLGHLYPQEAQTSTSAATNKGDLESGQGAPMITTTTTNITTQEEKDQPMQPIDDEALMLKRCSHIFHARCLATWYLRKKYSCPVCRTSYRRAIQETQRHEDYRIPSLLPAVGFW